MIAGFLVALIVLFAGQAFALESLSQNEFTTAESLDPGMTQAGIFLTAGNNYLSYYPAFRYGLGSFFEVGARVGAISMDVSAPLIYGIDGPTTNKLSALVGADVKYQLIKQTEDIPVDMAVDLGIDATSISGNNVSELSFATTVSRGFTLTETGYKLTPYGGIELSSQYSSSDYINNNENKTNLYAFGGVEWKLSQKFMMIAEIKSGSSTLGGFGIRFEY
jgi:hypothetical protein